MKYYYNEQDCNLNEGPRWNAVKSHFAQQPHVPKNTPEYDALPWYDQRKIAGENDKTFGYRGILGRGVDPNMRISDIENLPFYDRRRLFGVSKAGKKILKTNADSDRVSQLAHVDTLTNYIPNLDENLKGMILDNISHEYNHGIFPSRYDVRSDIQSEINSILNNPVHKSIKVGKRTIDIPFDETNPEHMQTRKDKILTLLKSKDFKTALTPDSYKNLAVDKNNALEAGGYNTSDKAPLYMTSDELKSNIDKEYQDSLGKIDNTKSIANRAFQKSLIKKDDTNAAKLVKALGWGSFALPAVGGAYKLLSTAGGAANSVLDTAGNVTGKVLGAPVDFYNYGHDKMFGKTPTIADKIVAAGKKYAPIAAGGAGAAGALGAGAAYLKHSKDSAEHEDWKRLGCDYIESPEKKRRCKVFLLDDQIRKLKMGFADCKDSDCEDAMKEKIKQLLVQKAAIEEDY